MVQRGWCSPTVCPRALALSRRRRLPPTPLTYPPTTSRVRPRHRALVGHFLFSAKFICMGKRKNRLTTIQMKNPHTPLFRFASSIDPPRPGGCNATGPAVVRALCVPQMAAEAGVPGRQNPTYPRHRPYKNRPTLHLSHTKVSLPHTSTIQKPAYPIPPTQKRDDPGQHPTTTGDLCCQFGIRRRPYKNRPTLYRPPPPRQGVQGKLRPP